MILRLLLSLSLTLSAVKPEFHPIHLWKSVESIDRDYFQQMRIPGPGGKAPAAGGGMARVCSGFATNDAAGTSLTTTANTGCAAANTCIMFYEEGGNAAVTFSSSPSATWVDATNGHAQSSGGAGDLYVSVATNISPGGSITFTATTASESFRRLMYACYSGGNVTNAFDVSCVSSGSLATSPGACATPGATITPAASTDVIVCGGSNNDGSTSTFTASSGFALDPNMGGSGGIANDTNLMYATGLSGAQTPQMTMSATGGSVRFQCTALKQ